jgi:hypothetical protein
MKKMLITFTAATLLSGGVAGTAALATALPAVAGDQGAPYQAADRPPARERWDAAGVEGARKDFENHRRPDVNNRKEYRHPHVKHHRKEYKEGFRRGYETAVEHLTSETR